jgi:hypothetical protein
VARKRYLTVEGVRCEVLEEAAEYGIMLGNGDVESGNHRLLIAPDGTLFTHCNPTDNGVPCHFTGHRLKHIEAHLRRLAAEAPHA